MINFVILIDSPRHYDEDRGKETQYFKPITDEAALFIAPQIKKLADDMMFNYPTNTIPFHHTGYLHQNGPLMIERTLKRRQDRVEIAFDLSLKEEFTELYNYDQESMLFCPKYPECHFKFTDNWEEVASSADSLVSTYCGNFSGQA